MNRRTVLKSGSILLAAPFAGCTRSGDGTQTTEPPTSTAPASTGPTDGAEPSVGTDSTEQPGTSRAGTGTRRETATRTPGTGTRAEFVTWVMGNHHGRPEPGDDYRTSLARFEVQFTPRFRIGTDEDAAVPFAVERDDEAGDVVLTDLRETEFMRFADTLVGTVLSTACSVSETGQAVAMVETTGTRDGREGSYRATVSGVCENARPPSGDDGHDHSLYETYREEDVEVTGVADADEVGHVFVSRVGWSEDWAAECVTVSEPSEAYPQGGRGLYYVLNPDPVAPLVGGDGCPDELPEDVPPKCDAEHGAYDPLQEPELSDWEADDVLTPIASTRGHFRESDWTPENYLTEGHTEWDYDTTGNTPVVDGGEQPDRLVVYVHGHANADDDAVGNFNRAYRSLKERNDYEDRIVGFSWDADVGINEFSDSNWRAIQNGPKLGHYIASVKCKSPGTTVHLVTHSLGARVAMEALAWLDDDRYWDTPSTFAFPDAEVGPIDSAHLMAAAIEDDALATRYGDTVARQVGYLYVYYNRIDDALDNWYDLTGEALGQNGPAGDTPANVTSQDVTAAVRYDHAGYNGESSSEGATGGADGIMDLVLAHVRQ